ADLVVGGGVAVAAVLLAHDLDRQAAARRHLLGANVARERRRLLHAEVEQDRLVAARGDQVLHEDDVLPPSVEVADDDDALHFFFTSGRVSRPIMSATGLAPTKP